jgi:hypothetical protein
VLASVLADWAWYLAGKRRLPHVGKLVQAVHLTVMDIYTLQALAIEAGSRLRGDHVVEVFNRLVMLDGALKMVFVDNGSEFTGRLMDM